MKAKYLILVLIVYIFLSIVLVEVYAQSTQSGKEFRYVKNEAFGFGEKLEYKVGYKFITAGTGYFHILPDPIEINGRKCFDIRFQVKSLESLDWLYRVRDQYRTALDVDGIFPWEFEQRVREGNYKRDFKATFDQYNNYAHVKEKKYKTPEYVNDIVSAFFYVRTMDLSTMKKDSTIYLQNFFDDTTHTLAVRIKGKETIEVEAGTFRCVVVEPIVKKGNLFQSDGSIFIWLSDDERKIPVRVATKIPIGFVGAELVKYSGLRGPLKAKIK